MRDATPAEHKASDIFRLEIELRLSEPVSPEVIDRRQRMVQRAPWIRPKMGPIGISTDDLLHEARRAERWR